MKRDIISSLIKTWLSNLTIKIIIQKEIFIIAERAAGKTGQQLLLIKHKTIFTFNKISVSMALMQWLDTKGQFSHYDAVYASATNLAR